MYSRKIEFRIPLRYSIMETDRNCNIEDHFMIKLKQRKRSWTLYCSTEAAYNEWVNCFKKYCFRRGWMDYYDIIEELDHHNLKARVQKVRKRNTREVFIAKIYDRIKVTSKSTLEIQVKNEVIVMRQLESERTTKLHEVYKEEDQIVLIIEYIRGGTLCQRVIDKRGFDEPNGAMLFSFLIEGLEDLHSRQILHRDIKLENIFLCSRSQDIFAKLGDFDLASPISTIDHNRLCGTPGYIAPEIFDKGHYSVKSDIFSAGVVLFTILTGKFPFRPREARDRFFARKPTPISFELSGFKRLSPEARELLQRMLSPEIDDRPTCAEILRSPWIVRSMNEYFATKVGSEPENCNVDLDEEYYLNVKERNIDNRTEVPLFPSVLFRNQKQRTVFEESKSNSANRSHEVCVVTTHFGALSSTKNGQSTRYSSSSHTLRDPYAEFSLFEELDEPPGTNDPKSFSGRDI
eukprot:TRINITY_DN3146_c0_g2_i4.p1 TRINITY_DN3146_c0_g2~~TRINITY_DN3146_c0_g2_i4.p1  ORF type:complete len:461 (-),score=25.59 TRINITY_DN3146_c0_g2_i4:79-1461(-)